MAASMSCAATDPFSCIIIGICRKHKDNLFRFVDNPDIGCILIDEAQFLTKAQVKQLADVTLQCKKPVLAYGLRTDFQGEPFEGSKYLLAWSDNLKELKAICHCGSKATMVLRLDENENVVNEGNQVEIGGKYLPIGRNYQPEVKSRILNS